MQRIEDILTGIMLIGSAAIVMVIVSMGVFAFARNANSVPLTLVFAEGFMILYTIRRITIGMSLIFHGRYVDDMTIRENRR